MKAFGTFPAIRALLSVMLVLSAGTAAWAQPAVTTTTLNVAPNSVAPDTAVTLTATVTSTTSGTITGQVLFCNASATHCEDSAIIGSAWMITSGTALGTATIHKTFGPGTYSIQAVFKGTNSYATSTSAAATVTVSSGPLPTTTTISATGAAGSYSLNATVWAGGAADPTGSVSFVDATNSNSPLGSALLSSAVPTLGFLFAGTSGPATSSANNQAIAVGDFNNDGNLDYVVASLNSAIATIMLGSGNGTFTAVTTGGAPYSVNPNPEGAVVADFNGDGNLDIAFANSAGNGVTILLGNGDGTFTPAANPAVSFAAAITVGDFNGDGIPDLAVSNNGSGYAVTILLGNGDGTFNVGANVSVPQWSLNPQGIVAMDFNGDGKTDLAVTSANGNSPSNYVVSILLGNGDGTFTQGQTYNTGQGDQSIAGGDFNGDGIPDLAIANYYDHTVTILLGNGDGTFTPVPPPLPATGDGPFAIVAGDFNNDGLLDLATANFHDNTVTILLGNGDGTFTGASSALATGGGPDGLVAGDFNGDGLLDVVTANYQVATQSILQQASSSTTVTISGVTAPGTDSVFASYSGDGNYSSSQSSTVAIDSILLAAQTITFPNPGAQTYGTPLTLSAYSSSGLPVSFTVVSGPATLSGNTLTFTAAGSVTVQATQGGNSSYAAATPVSVSFTVNPAAQTITFPNPGPLPNGVAPVTLTATASSGLPVTYSLISGPGSLSGSTLTITDVGDIIVEADQAGNANYLAAPSVQIDISVVSAAFTVVPQSSTPTTIPSPGQTGTIPVTVNAARGFTATVSFTCTTPAAMLEASCSASSVQVTGSAPVTANVTVNTQGPHQVSALSWPKPWNALPSGIAFAAIVVASSAGRKKKKLRRAMLLAGLIVVMLAVLVSCGGSSSSTKTDPGTPAGNYNLTLVGTSGNTNYTVTLPVTVD